MTHFLSLTLFVYVFFRLVMPLPLPFMAKGFMTFLLLLIALKNFFFQYFFGGLSAPDLPRSIIMMGGYFFALLAFLFLFTALRDAILILSYLVRHPLSIMNVKTSFVIIFAALSCCTYGLYEATKIPTPKLIPLYFKNLPKALDGIRIVQLSDIHINNFNPAFKVQELVHQVNQLRPDLIVLTGDMVDGTVAKREKDVLPLKQLKATYGVFGIVGNHEYYSNDYDNWCQKFKSLGVKMLLNENATLFIGQEVLSITGITDPVAKRFHKELPNIDKALQTIPKDAFTILLSHRPDNAKENATRLIDLQLSGHTHGGQIIGLNQIVSLLNQNFLQGEYDLKTMKLYISSGICLWNGFPIRLGVPSEMPVIILKSQT